MLRCVVVDRRVVGCKREREVGRTRAFYIYSAVSHFLPFVTVCRLSLYSR